MAKIDFQEYAKKTIQLKKVLKKRKNKLIQKDKNF